MHFFLLDDVNKHSYYPTSTPGGIRVDSTWILRRYVEEQFSTSFHVISTNFFDLISLIEKSTSFPHTFFDVISMVEKSTLFPHTFFDVISMVEKSTLFPHVFFLCNFDGRKIHLATTQFFQCNFSRRNIYFVSTYFFDLILMVEKSTLCFDKFWMNLTSFLVSCKLMKTFEGVLLCQ